MTTPPKGPLNQRAQHTNNPDRNPPLSSVQMLQCWNLWYPESKSNMSVLPIGKDLAREFAKASGQLRCDLTALGGHLRTQIMSRALPDPPRNETVTNLLMYQERPDNNYDLQQRFIDLCLKPCDDYELFLICKEARVDPTCYGLPATMECPERRGTYNARVTKMDWERQDFFAYVYCTKLTRDANVDQKLYEEEMKVARRLSSRVGRPLPEDIAKRKEFEFKFSQVRDAHCPLPQLPLRELPPSTDTSTATSTVTSTDTSTATPTVTDTSTATSTVTSASTPPFQFHYPPITSTSPSSSSPTSQAPRYQTIAGFRSTKRNWLQRILTGATSEGTHRIKLHELAINIRTSY